MVAAAAAQGYLELVDLQLVQRAELRALTMAQQGEVPLILDHQVLLYRAEAQAGAPAQ